MEEKSVLKRIDHIAIAVDDLTAAGKFLADAFGCHRTGRTVDSPGRFRAEFFTFGESQLEIIEIVDPQERVRRLGGAEARIEHIAVEVEDVRALIEALSKLGVRPTQSDVVRAADSLSIWTEPSTSDGVAYQFVEKL